MTAGFVRLTPELWVRQCRSMHYNTGVYVSGGEAALIDPGLFADEFDLIRRLLAERGAEPRVLVLTHSHWDHVLGPEQFPGVRVLAHERYPALAAEFAEDIRWGLAHWERQFGIQRERPFVPPVAQATVGAAGMLSVGDLTLRLRHVPGHAPDQLALYQAEAGVLCCGDYLSPVEIPMLSEGGSVDGYLATLARLEPSVERATWVVPGHGAPASEPAEIRARFAHDQAYLAELGERVARAVAAGRSVEETVAACADMEFRLKDKSQFDHRLNVESVYLELGGQADPKQVGWNKDWQNAAEQWESG